MREKLKRRVGGILSRATYLHPRLFTERLESRRLLTAAASSSAVELLNASPAVFVENAGQWSDPSVRFVQQASGATDQEVPAESVIANRSFETDSGWVASTNGQEFSGSYVSNWASEGSRSYQFTRAAGGASAGNSVQISQIVNLTGIQGLLFDCQDTGIDAEILQFLVDGNVVGQFTNDGWPIGTIVDKGNPSNWGHTATTTGISISFPFPFTGAHTLTLRMYEPSNYGPLDAKIFRIDNLRTVAASLGVDLIAQNVTFASGSTLSGGTSDISFRIRNIGSVAAAATQARLRLSADTNLTLYDKPLSPLDVNIPAIPAGQYYDYSGPFTVPAGTTAGQYYVGVFADRDNRAGQSNITNDAGLSATTLTVTAPAGAVAPTITRQPVALTVQQGQSGQLSVEAVGTGPLTYVWYHNNIEMTGETRATVPFRTAGTKQSGSYFVIVSNSVNTVTSATVQVTVTGEPVVPPAAQSDLGALISYQGRAIDPSLPTVVITHGWQFVLNYETDPNKPLDAWVNTMQGAISLRLGTQRPANILAFVWRKAFTLDYGIAESNTPEAGKALAVLLKNALGVNYAKDLQFIGHSLGNIVNAEAVSQLKAIGSGIDVEQFTILDAPMKMRSIIPQSFPGQNYLIGRTILYGADFFDEKLPGSGQPYSVDWVDNYFGLAGWGTWIPGAAPIGGKQLPLTHDGVHDWYIGTIAEGGAREGFEFSVLLGSENYLPRPIPTPWYNDPNLLEKVVYAMPSALGVLTGGVGVRGGWVPFVGDVVQGATIFTTQNLTALLLKATGQNRPSDDSPQSQFVSAPSPVAAAGLDFVIPESATTLRFDYRLVNATAADQFVISFNDNPIMTLRGDLAVDSGIGTAAIPIGQLAGQSGVLEISLYASDGSPAELSIANMRLSDEAPPQVLAKSTQLATGDSLSFSFNELVENLQASSLSLLSLDSGQPYPTTAFELTEDGTIANWSVNSAALPSGRYRAVLAGGVARDAVGNVMEDPASFDFLYVSSGGTLMLESGFNTVNQIVIRDGGRLDIGTDGVALDYTGASPFGTWNGSAYSGLSGSVASGKNQGAGIGSSANAVQGVAGVAIAEASEVLSITGSQTKVWFGRTVDATSVLIKFTYLGDANMDGVINADDYAYIDLYSQIPGSRTYAHGDFNLDGAINADDYAYIDLNATEQGSPL
jgi:hypothetical protein